MRCSGSTQSGLARRIEDRTVRGRNRFHDVIVNTIGFHGKVGQSVRLTRERSPVRAWVEPILLPVPFLRVRSPRGGPETVTSPANHSGVAVTCWLRLSTPLLGPQVPAALRLKFLTQTVLPVLLPVLSPDPQHNFVHDDGRNH